jgi:inner membrane protein
MDNFSHSVVGLAVGELIHRSLPEEIDATRRSLRRRLMLVSSWLSSNFPDLDIVLSPLLPRPLGYLLHHRGHTHTLLYALPQALLIGLMIWLLWPSARRLMKADHAARNGFFIALAGSLVLHLLMDYLNSYGIHPFHPFDSRWFYGDMVFILEPLFWIAFGVPMAMTVPNRGARMLLVAALIGAPLYFTIGEFLTWTSFSALVLIALVLAILQRRAGARGRSALAAAAIVGFAFIGVQDFASGEARRAVAADLERMDPASRLLDVSMTAFPTNPFCWTFVAVESNESAGTYRLRRGQLSIAPRTPALAACASGFVEATPPAQPQRAGTPVVFLFEQQGKLDTLRELKKGNCHFEAWLRFARAPALSSSEASDLRFSFGGRSNFTTMRFEDFRERECPRHVPHWGFPRADLLTPPVPR